MMRVTTTGLTALRLHTAGALLIALTLIATALAGTPAQAGPLGDWEKQEYRIEGSFRIDQRADGAYLVLSDDFKTRRGPDLKIFLHTAEAGAVTGGNAAQGKLVSVLESRKGAQEYKLPAGIDLAAFQSVVIHCERFSKLWGAGNLRA